MCGACMHVFGVVNVWLLGGEAILLGDNWKVLCSIVRMNVCYVAKFLRTV